MGGTDQIIDIADKAGVDTVILAIPRNRSEHLVRNILEARLKGISVLDMADVYETLTGRIPVGSIGDQWLLFAQGFYLLRADYVQKLKRLMDFMASGLILLAMSPILSLAFVAIKLDSPGPVFYTQQRVGKDRKVVYYLQVSFHAVPGGRRGCAMGQGKRPQGHPGGKDPALDPYR